MVNVPDAVGERREIPSDGPPAVDTGQDSSELGQPDGPVGGDKKVDPGY